MSLAAFRAHSSFLVSSGGKKKFIFLFPRLLCLHISVGLRPEVCTDQETAWKQTPGVGDPMLLSPVFEQWMDLAPSVFPLLTPQLLPREIPPA